MRDSDPGAGRWSGMSGGGIMTGESPSDAGGDAPAAGAGDAAAGPGSAEVTKPTWRNRGSTPPEEERGGGRRMSIAGAAGRGRGAGGGEGWGVAGVSRKAGRGGDSRGRESRKPRRGGSWSCRLPRAVRAWVSSSSRAGPWERVASYVGPPPPVAGFEGLVAVVVVAVLREEFFFYGVAQ